MMIKLPTPIHGWRAFSGEVGIIVVGVLIALAAQQLVENANGRSEVRTFRVLADGEVAYNLASVQYRMAQNRCIDARIAALEAWRDAARAGKPIRPIVTLGRPNNYALARGVWDSRNGDLMRQMPLDLTIAYSSLYDGFDNVTVQTRDEREAWRSLSAFVGTTKLDEADLKRLTEFIARVKSLNRVLKADWAESVGQGADLGVRPNFGKDQRYVTPPDPEMCQPMLGPAA